MISASRQPATAMSTRSVRIALVAAALIGAGCASRPTVTAPPAPPVAQPQAVAPVPPPAVAARPAPEAVSPAAPRPGLPETSPPSAAVPSAPVASLPAARGSVEQSAPATGATGGPPFDAGGALTLEAGLYRCELDRRVIVRRIAADGRSLVLNWRGRDSVLHAVQARTGALRFENPDTGHIWLVIVGKSMLLDGRAGRTLANECRL